MEINTENYYIVRGDKSGVFFGHISNRNGGEVTMTNARRIWYWEGANTLSQLAMEGTKKGNSCKFTMRVSEILILDAIEIIPCTEDAVKSIEGVKEWKA